MQNFIKKFIGFVLSAVVVALTCVSCSSHDLYQQKLNAWLKPADKLPVLCTTEMVEALVSYIGGSYVSTLSLVYGELDPHSYQMVKGDNQKLERAKIVFCNGLDLEHGPSLKSALSNHPHVVYLGDQLMKVEPESFVYHGGVVDPHIWLDVELFSKLCPSIASELSKIDPQNALYYQKRAGELGDKLKDLHMEVRERFHQIPYKRRYLVTSHEAFYYLAKAYLRQADEEELRWKDRFCAPEGLAPESQISLHRIMEIVDYIQCHKVKSAFIEVNVGMDAIRKVQEVLSKQSYDLEIPSEPLYSDCMPSMGQEHGLDPTERYIHMIRSNAGVILNQWNRL